MRTNLDTFIEFKNVYPNNGWFEINGIAIYVRNSAMFLHNHKYHHVFQIANVGVVNPKLKGQKKFTQLFRHIENSIKLHNYDAIYIENIFEERFVQFFLRQEYIRILPQHPGPPTCVYKILRDENAKK